VVTNPSPNHAPQPASTPSNSDASPQPPDHHQATLADVPPQPGGGRIRQLCRAGRMPLRRCGIVVVEHRAMVGSGRVGRVRRQCRTGLKDRPIRAHLLSPTPGRLRYRTIMNRPMVPVAQQRMINSPDRGEVAQGQPGIATRTTATAVGPRTRLRVDDSSDDNADDNPAPAAPCETWLRRRSQSRSQVACIWGSRGRRFKSCRPDGRGSSLVLSDCPGQRAFLWFGFDHDWSFTVALREDHQMETGA
jgi:hypothetical protein